MINQEAREQVKQDKDYYQAWFEWDRGAVKRYLGHTVCAHGYYQISSDGASKS
jgi:hypothetical protein